MTIGTHNKFSYTAFIATVSRVTGIMILLFIAVFIAAESQIGKIYGKESNTDPFFVVPAIIYLTFIFGWAVAYTKFFRFPENQRLLLAGVCVGSLIMPVIGGIVRVFFDHMTFPELLTALPEFIAGSLLGAAMQMYFMVIVLRYVFRFRLPF